jgi:hypothetical protein
LRRICLFLSFLFWPAMVFAQTMTVRLEGDQLRIAAPQLHFIGTEVLARLHNGIAVNYIFRLGIAPDRLGKPMTEVTYRFVVSYDIFEEKFAINRLEPNPRSITHLSQAAAEVWCLDSIALSTTRLTPEQSFWLVLDYRAEEPKLSGGDGSNSTDTLIGQLIDIFGRKSQRQETRGSMTAGPLRIAELRKIR